MQEQLKFNMLTKGRNMPPKEVKLYTTAHYSFSSPLAKAKHEKAIETLVRVSNKVIRADVNKKGMTSEREFRELKSVLYIKTKINKERVLWKHCNEDVIPFPKSVDIGKKFVPPQFLFKNSQKTKGVNQFGYVALVNFQLMLVKNGSKSVKKTQKNLEKIFSHRNIRLSLMISGLKTLINLGYLKLDNDDFISFSPENEFVYDLILPKPKADEVKINQPDGSIIKGLPECRPLGKEKAGFWKFFKNRNLSWRSVE